MWNSKQKVPAEMTNNNFSLLDLLKRFHGRRVFKQQINSDDFAEYFMFKQGHVPWEFKHC